MNKSIFNWNDIWIVDATFAPKKIFERETRQVVEWQLSLHPATPITAVVSSLILSKALSEWLFLFLLSLKFSSKNMKNYNCIQLLINQSFYWGLQLFDFSKFFLDIFKINSAVFNQIFKISLSLIYNVVN